MDKLTKKSLSATVYYKKSMFLHKKCSDFHLLEIHNSKSIQDKQKKIAGKKKKISILPFPAIPIHYYPCNNN